MEFRTPSFTHDYHVHTRYSPDVKEGSFRDYCVIAEKEGIHIGFLDHFKIWKLNDPTYPLSREKIPQYLEEFDNVKSEFADTSLGLEVDYYPEKLGALEEFLEDHRGEFDRFIGAVHIVFDEVASTLEGLKTLTMNYPLEKICEEYLRMVEKAVESRLFDGIAHLDGIYRWIRRTNLSPVVDEGELLELGRLCKRRGVMVELNIRSDSFPLKRILRRLLDENTVFFVGSDSHSPEEFSRALYRIKEANKLLQNHDLFLSRSP